ncbi:hypothetical protein ABH935_006201 [Catenulispora sp. GAS73]|uniref:hypothetical protein n=1 Tax=Catenulispora sp. GAS73 TaxID=3156269 RepID=UPI003519C809
MAMPDYVGQLKGTKVDAFLRELVQLDVQDLRAILVEVFKLQGYEGDRVVNYFNQTGHALSLVYVAAGNKKHPDTVRELRREASLTEADVVQLRELLKIAQGPQADHLASFFSFSSRPVAGWWKYRDQFQIVPPPPNAPVPSTVVGDWPFIVEARYRSLDHFGVKIQRRTQATTHLRLLLPVLVIGPKFKPNVDRGTKHWVIPPPDRTAEPQPTNLQRLLAALHLRRRPTQQEPFQLTDVMYAQEFYGVAGHVIGGPELTELDQADAITVLADHEAYYRTRGIGVDDVLQVPAVLTQLLDNYYALDEKEASRYRRACYWFNMGYFFHGYSISSSFFALVAAIESLLPTGNGPHKCPDCRADHYPSISKTFREFLETYVPDRPDRDSFYDMRSKIVHGSALLHLDLREEFGGFYPGQLDQGEELDNLYRVCRISLVNWLLGQGAA